MITTRAPDGANKERKYFKSEFFITERIFSLFKYLEKGRNTNIDIAITALFSDDDDAAGWQVVRTEAGGI